MPTLEPPTDGVNTPPKSDQTAESAPTQRDPYAALDAHVISVLALHCEDGCGLVETSGYGDDQDAAKELDARGWTVRPHSLGGLTALCKACTERHDIEAAEGDDE